LQWIRDRIRFARRSSIEILDRALRNRGHLGYRGFRMRVFVSWSGTKSRAVAEALRDWIPFVLPTVEPWMSATDIDRGARWSVEVASQLDSANVGIICLTPENLEAPWILFEFEAGALSKILSKSLVCTYLFQLRLADVRGPLAQFQPTMADNVETKRLVVSMNKALGPNMVPDSRLDKMFDRWWPELEGAFQGLTHQEGERTAPRRTDRDLIEEILTLQRRSDPGTLAPELAKHILSFLNANGQLKS
jgi:TIR domain